MSTYHLTLEQFSGPLDKLLELIEERKLPINTVSLAKVTDDFLGYLEAVKNDKESNMSADRTRILADFIVIASRLILIKSKSLIPELKLTPEEEVEIKDLEERLKIYREFRRSFKIIFKRYREKNNEYSRPYFLHIAGVQGMFHPGTNVSVAGILGSLTKIVSTFEALNLERQTIKDTIISIEEKIGEIVERLSKSGEASFRNLSGKKSRSEIIAIFLAILHLAREQLVLLEQENGFSDIIIRKKQKDHHGAS